MKMRYNAQQRRRLQRAQLAGGHVAVGREMDDIQREELEKDRKAKNLAAAGREWEHEVRGRTNLEHARVVADQARHDARVTRQNRELAKPENAAERARVAKEDAAIAANNKRAMYDALPDEVKKKYAVEIAKAHPDLLRQNVSQTRGHQNVEQRLTSRWDPKAYAVRLAAINRRRFARGKTQLGGKPGDKPGHPFRGNQYRPE